MYRTRSAWNLLFPLQSVQSLPRKYLCCAVIVSVRVQRFRVAVRLDQVAGTRKSALAVRSFTSRRNRNSGNHQTAAAVEGYDMGDTSSYASDY
ncbi:Hypothetical protein SMAX5B_004155 [Scophthalmus maximus]|uniref:Uncharacterized protein n=1 Tax=Scophthalmus maximus TaxID=52904 RepID=A0A2U9B8S2_SCOMX|nr:Hypothetical protein SMAX5B_004155 [Scophthalmus maximus]